MIPRPVGMAPGEGRRLVGGGAPVRWLGVDVGCCATDGGGRRTPSGGRGQEGSPSGAPRSFLPGPGAGPAGALPCAP